MPRGEKSSYTGKQKRMASHIEKGYEKRGTSRKEAERRAWATVNKQTGGGKKTGGSRKGTRSRSNSHKGTGGSTHAKRVAAGRKGGRARARSRA